MPDPRELRRRGFRALRTLLANVGQRAHLVIAIDDLQWGDVDSAELLASLLEPQPGVPLRALFVAAFRSEYRESSACLRVLSASLAGPWQDTGLVEIGVQPLEEHSALTLATALLGQSGGPAAASRIVRESGGNPFFIGELARYALEHPEWLTGDRSGTFDLDQVLWARVTRLPAAARSLLELVAIAGQPLRNVYWRDASDAAAPRSADLCAVAA